MTIKLLEGFAQKAASVGATITNVSQYGSGTSSYTNAGRGPNAWSVRSAHNIGGANNADERFSITNVGPTGALLSSATFAFALAMMLDISSDGGAKTNRLRQNNDYNILEVKEGATLHLAMRVNTAGNIELIRGDGTVLATGTDVFDVSAWVGSTAAEMPHFEIRGNVADAGGSVYGYVNGVLVASATGVDTRNGGTAGLVSGFTAGFKTGSSSGYGDGVRLGDIVVSDTNAQLGNNVVENVFPNAAGDTTGWTPSSGANWDAVNDLSSADYVEAVASGTTDLYNLTDASTSYGAVLATQTMVLAAKSDSGTPNGPLQVAQKGAGGATITDTVVSAAAISTGYAWYQAPIKELDPDGNAWTTARFNALQVGVKVG